MTHIHLSCELSAVVNDIYLSAGTSPKSSCIPPVNTADIQHDSQNERLVRTWEQGLRAKYKKKKNIVGNVLCDEIMLCNTGLLTMRRRKLNLDYASTKCCIFTCLCNSTNALLWYRIHLYNQIIGLYDYVHCESLFFR